MPRWKPEKGERYFFVGDNGYVNFTYWDNEEVDHDYYKFGNVFQTKEEAERALEKVRELFFNFHKMKELEEMFVVCKGKSEK
jgi:hypothetical protein